MSCVRGNSDVPGGRWNFASPIAVEFADVDASRRSRHHRRDWPGRLPPSFAANAAWADECKGQNCLPAEEPPGHGLQGHGLHAGRSSAGGRLQGRGLRAGGPARRCLRGRRTACRHRTSPTRIARGSTARRRRPKTARARLRARAAVAARRIAATSSGQPFRIAVQVSCGAGHRPPVALHSK